MFLKSSLFLCGLFKFKFSFLRSLFDVQSQILFHSNGFCLVFDYHFPLSLLLGGLQCSPLGAILPCITFPFIFSVSVLPQNWGFLLLRLPEYSLHSFDLMLSTSGETFILSTACSQFPKASAPTLWSFHV